MILRSFIIFILLVVATPAAEVSAAASPVTTASATDSSQSAKLEFPLAGYRINVFESNPATFPLQEPRFFTISTPEGVVRFPRPGAMGFDGLALNVPGANLEHPALSIGRPLPADPKWTLQDSVDKIHSMLKHFGDTKLSEHASPTDFQVEYTEGLNGGPKNHIYERMGRAHGASYSIEARVPDAQWPELGPKLKAAVDSFEPSPDPAPGKLAFSKGGFRFSPLDGMIPKDRKQWLLLMFGVSVSVEPYSKTIKDYQAERKLPLFFGELYSEEEFLKIFGKTLNKEKMANIYPVLVKTMSERPFKILAENMPAENALVTEYAEDIPADQNHPQGSRIVTYEKVVLAHGQLYRAIGHLNEADPKYSALLKSCVESLEALPTPASASTSATTPASTLAK